MEEKEAPEEDQQPTACKYLCAWLGPGLPPPPPEDAEHQKLQIKYQKRVSEEGGCYTPKGMWGNPFNSRCTIVTMAQIGKYKPNDLILDWGTGCGHQATWMTRYFPTSILFVFSKY